MVMKTAVTDALELTNQFEFLERSDVAPHTPTMVVAVVRNADVVLVPADGAVTGQRS